jgi:arylsulfatase A
LSLLLRENQAPASSPFYYYRSGNLDAVRLERWKLHIPHNFRYVDQVANDGNRGSYAYRYSELELYDLYGDPGEVYNVAEEFPGKGGGITRPGGVFSRRYAAGKARAIPSG